LHNTLETVDGETPAAAATSLIFATRLLRNRFHQTVVGLPDNFVEMLTPIVQQILTQKVVSISIVVSDTEKHTGDRMP
jgi:hypothetical protein